MLGLTDFHVELGNLRQQTLALRAQCSNLRHHAIEPTLSGLDARASRLRRLGTCVCASARRAWAATTKASLPRPGHCWAAANFARPHQFLVDRRRACWMGKLPTRRRGNRPARRRHFRKVANKLRISKLVRTLCGTVRSSWNSPRHLPTPRGGPPNSPRRRNFPGNVFTTPCQECLQLLPKCCRKPLNRPWREAPKS